MENLWNDAEAAHFSGDLGQCIYASRLLGRDSSLVMHGGGNTSVKIREKNIFGEDEDILYVKGSGWDLATIEAAGFAPLRLAALLRLAGLETLTDTQMASAFRSSMTNADAPAPSVEAILHALLPAKFVYHTHADAVIAITNTPGGDQRIREVYGDLCVFIPYVMPGFRLARHCAQAFPAAAGPETIGMALHRHGIFSFGDTSRAAYERMIELVDLAERYLQRHNAWHIALPEIPEAEKSSPQGGKRLEIAALRRDISQAAGFPVIMATHSDPECLNFARRSDVAALSQQGCATPDHVIRTKRLPLLGRDVAGYAARYEREFAALAAQSGRDLKMLDAAPRVVLDPELGLCTAGRTAGDAAIAEDIYRHTMQIILRAAALGGYEALPAADIFEVEYWDLEQAKLRRAGAAAPFAGEVALVTGAASGIGKACAEAFINRGAAVTGLDINPAITQTFRQRGWLGLACDLTQEAAVGEALETAVCRFGGLDMLILNAGIFPRSRAIADLNLDEWRQVMGVNLDSYLTLMRESLPLLKLAPKGGRVVIIGSKNVPAPGPGAAAYSASKAAVTQLGRVAALEWGAHGIRVNVIHPNAVFDTGLWTEDVLRARAEHYGMTVEAYRTNNVLRAPVTSHDVAEMAAAMCGPAFARTTGAQVPVDGGNERVI